MSMQSSIIVQSFLPNKANVPTCIAFRVTPQSYHLDQGIESYGIVCDLEDILQPGDTV